MTDVDPVRDAERRVRDDLRRELVPPPTPATLYAAVDRLAIDPPRASERSRRSIGGFAGRPSLRAALGAAAVVALAIGLLAVFEVSSRERVAATPRPSLPAVIGPALPSSVSGTLLREGEWIDASTAWTIDQAENLRISEDGGQTWSEPRHVAQPTDLGFDMLDANRGYVGWYQRHANTWVPVLYWTSDGGRTWDPPVEAGSLDVLGTDRAYLSADVHFVDPLHGAFVVTSRASDEQTADEQCSAFATDDGGAHWSELATAPCLDAGGILWETRTLGMIQTVSPSSITVTQDGGRTWTTAPAPVDNGAPLFTVDLVARSTNGTLRILGNAVKDSETTSTLTVYESRDDGRSWAAAYPAAGLPLINPGLAWALDGEHWLAAAELDWLAGMDLYESFDAGRTWTTASRGAHVQPGTMRWYDRLHGSIQGVPIECSAAGCGGDGTVLFTNDGGQTWHEVAPPIDPGASPSPALAIATAAAASDAAVRAASIAGPLTIGEIKHGTYADLWAGSTNDPSATGSAAAAAKASLVVWRVNVQGPSGFEQIYLDQATGAVVDSLVEGQ